MINLHKLQKGHSLGNAIHFFFKTSFFSWTLFKTIGFRIYWKLTYFMYIFALYLQEKLMKKENRKIIEWCWTDSKVLKISTQSFNTPQGGERKTMGSTLMVKEKQGMFLFAHPNSLIRMYVFALGLCQGKASWETWLALPNPYGSQKVCYYHDIYIVFWDTKWNEQTTKE